MKKRSEFSNSDRVNGIHGMFYSSNGKWVLFVEHVRAGKTVEGVSKVFDTILELGAFLEILDK